MKKILSIITVLVLITSLSYGKKVKFAVDMTGQTINTTGMHISGDFQTIAGFPGGDWSSNSTPLTQEGSTDIYSIIVDIPAFAKYEYKFLNGDQFYDAEFVPLESRANYNFSDNRFLYIDSLADDTTFAGAILYGGNAPSGLYLVRFSVNSQQLSSVSPAGMHVAGNFQNWDPATHYLYSFTGEVHEIISYVTAGAYEYKYYNGNTIADAETVPGSCMVNLNREIIVSKDTVLDTYCFATCLSCLVGIEENDILSGVKVYPNPAENFSVVSFEEGNHTYTLTLTDITGRKTAVYTSENKNSIRIETESISKGLYFINVVSDQNKIFTGKLIVN